MIERCFGEGIIPGGIDGSDFQMKALKWMFQQINNIHK